MLENTGALRNWEKILDEVNSQGYSLLKTNVSDVWILEVLARNLGKIRGGSFWKGCFNIVFSPGQRANDSTALSSSEFPFHTDGSFENNPPRYFIIHCVISDLEGFGKLILVDGEHIVKYLPSSVLSTLAEADFVFMRSRTDGTASATGKIIVDTDPGFQFRYRNDRNFKLSTDDMVAQNALDQFGKELQNRMFHNEIYLQAGDVLIVDNFRMFHSRTALSGRAERLHRRLWVD